jgi:hypothetical protein
MSTHNTILSPLNSLSSQIPSEQQSALYPDLSSNFMNGIMPATLQNAAHRTMLKLAS